jgi:hypothetical protein
MPRAFEGHRTDLLDRVAAAVRRLDDDEGADFDGFLRLYVRHVPPQDVAGLAPDTLVGAACGRKLRS